MSTLDPREAALIRRIGFEPSKRPSRNASIIGRRELVDRAAAVAWLDHTPELPGSDDDAGAPCPVPPTPPTSPLTSSQSVPF
jgi:hypothetical protein